MPIPGTVSMVWRPRLDAQTINRGSSRPDVRRWLHFAATWELRGGCSTQIRTVAITSGCVVRRRSRRQGRFRHGHRTRRRHRARPGSRARRGRICRSRHSLRREDAANTPHATYGRIKRLTSAILRGEPEALHRMYQDAKDLGSVGHPVPPLNAVTPSVTPEPLAYVPTGMRV